MKVKNKFFQYDLSHNKIAEGSASDDFNPTFRTSFCSMRWVQINIKIFTNVLSVNIDKNTSIEFEMFL